MNANPSTIYYESLKGMLRKYNMRSREDRFHGHTKEEHQSWKIKSRDVLKNLLGLQWMEKTELNAQVLEQKRFEPGILYEKILLETEPEIIMPVVLLIPEEEFKGIFLALSGHKGVGKESVTGCRDSKTVAEAIDYYNYDYGYQLAKLGYVVACPEARGFGERRERLQQGDSPEQLLSCSCLQLAHMAEGLGETVAGMQVWDYMRLIDYLAQRGEWDLSKLGCIGFSGGGMHTLWLSATDERIQQIYISGYFYGMRDSLLFLNNNCSCNYIPGLWNHFDMGDVAALLAPRPLLIQSCKDDNLNGPRGLDNVYEQIEIAKEAYTLYDAESRLIHEIFPGIHHMHTDHLSSLIEQFDQILNG